MTSFVSFDFETANSNRASACSLGMTKVINGEITEQKYEIFKPPAGFDNFEPRNIGIHRIKPEDVQGKSRFGDIWGEFHSFIGDLPVVAHNASFDVSVLRGALLESDIEWPELEYACTWVMSRAMFELTSHSLLYVAQKANVKWDSEKHHDALYDSEICAQVLLSMARLQNQQSLKGLLKSLNLQMGLLFSDGWYTCRSTKRSITSHHTSNENRWSANQIEINSDADPDHPFFGKVIVFTGKLYSMPRPDAWKLVAALGATPKDSMTKSTNILVVGEQDPFKLSPGQTQSGKFREAERMREQGADIEVITETEFLSYLEPAEGTARKN